MGAETKQYPLEEYTFFEELIHVITHGIGLFLAMAAPIVLVTLSQDSWQMLSFSIYGATLIFMYLSSVFYHSFRSPRLKYIFRIFDHSSIFLLIAGSYTPFLLINMRNGSGWKLFWIIWGLATCGILLKSFLWEN